MDFASMNIDLNSIRAVITALAFASFIGIAVWAYAGARRPRFDDAARLPLDDDCSDLEPRVNHD